MPKITFSKEALLERKQLSADWYHVQLKSVKEETAKDKESINYVSQFVIQSGTQQGVPVRHWFSEKAMGRIVGFFQCFTNPEAGKEYQFEDLLNRDVLAYIQFDPQMGFNKIEDFRPFKKA